MSKELQSESASEQNRPPEIAARQQGLKPSGDLYREAYPGTDEDEGIDLRHYWSVLLRRRWTLVSALVIAVLVGLVVTYNTTPIYRSSLTLQIEPVTDQFLEYQHDVSVGGAQKSSYEYLHTQLELLRSRALARRVVDQLGLESTRKPRRQRAPSFLADLKHSIEGWVGGADDDKSGTDPTESQGGAKPNLAGALLGNLTVSPIMDTNIVRVQYDSPNAAQAAAVANAFAENFIDMSLERRYEAMSYVKRFLQERLDQVRANLEDSERRLVAYARELEIVNLDDKLSTLMQTFNAMHQALVQAEASLIKADAKHGKSAEGTDPAASEILDSQLISTLKTRKLELDLQYQEDRKVYKPDYPKMQQLRRQISEINRQIKAEVASIRGVDEAQYEAKVREKEGLQARVKELKSEILALQDRSADYQAMKREVDTNRQLYDGLLQRMKEVGVVAGISSNNFSIVDRALVPPAPYKPSLRENLMVSLALGLVAGVLLVFLLEQLDDTVKTSEDVESRIFAPVLGILPFVKEHRDGGTDIALLAAGDPKSPLAEAVRSLRTSLVFSTSEGAPKIMHLASSGSGEGKTATATNIAIAFAQAGDKVLLVDADLRVPSLHRVFGLPNTSGLTNYLTGDLNPADIAQPTQIVGLFTITSGPLPPNPVELLASVKMLNLLSLAASRFDYVILDGPPVIGLADAIVLAKLAQGTIFVVDAGRTRYGALEGSTKRLRAANAKVIGAVIDRFGRAGTGYGYGYGYDYHHRYDYGDRDKGTALQEDS